MWGWRDFKRHAALVTTWVSDGLTLEEHAPSTANNSGDMTSKCRAHSWKEKSSSLWTKLSLLALNGESACEQSLSASAEMSLFISSITIGRKDMLVTTCRTRLSILSPAKAIPIEFKFFGKVVVLDLLGKWTLICTPRHLMFNIPWCLSYDNGNIPTSVKAIFGVVVEPKGWLNSWCTALATCLAPLRTGILDGLLATLTVVSTGYVDWASGWNSLVMPGAVNANFRLVEVLLVLVLGRSHARTQHRDRGLCLISILFDNGCCCCDGERDSALFALTWWAVFIVFNFSDWTSFSMSLLNRWTFIVLFLQSEQIESGSPSPWWTGVSRTEARTTWRSPVKRRCFCLREGRKS